MVTGVQTCALPITSEMKVEAQTVTVPTQEPKKEESHPSSPLAKVILKENSIDTDKVTGTGVGGKITKEDAIKAVAAMGRAQGNRKQTVTKLSVLRRKLAARLVFVKNETAMLTTFNEVDMSESSTVVTSESDELFPAYACVRVLGCLLIRPTVLPV